MSLMEPPDSQYVAVCCHPPILVYTMNTYREGAASVMEKEELPRYLTGYLLIADPDLRDPNFFHTVVLLVEHNEAGAFGLVLNRPGSAALGEVLPEFTDPDNPAENPPVLDDAASSIAAIPIYVGGPVQREYLFVLHSGLSGRELGEHAAKVQPGIIYEPMTALMVRELTDCWPDFPSGERERLRVFAGYSGWGPDQLEGEMKTGCWIVLESTPELVFPEDPDTIWEQALTAKGGIYAIIARTGFKPSLN